MSFIRIKRKRNEEPLDALLIDEQERDSDNLDKDKRPQPRKKRQKQGLFKLAETVEESTFNSNQTKEELQARLKRKAEDDLSEHLEVDEQRRTPPRQLKRRPQKRYHVVLEGDQGASKDVFIDVQEEKERRRVEERKSGNSSTPFDPYDEDSEQMREFRKLVEDYLKMQEVVTIKEDDKDDDNKDTNKGKDANTANTEDADDYVFDLYYRNSNKGRHSPQVMSNIGLLTGLNDEFGVDFDNYSSDSTDIQDEADEDSNEEDYYTNDYPDEEVGSEEEYAGDFVDDDSD